MDKKNLEKLTKKKEELTIEERLAIIESLRGIAAVEGKIPPTDEEAKENYYNYLAEKYK